jgi:Tol biopolymer transport system component
VAFTSEASNLVAGDAFGWDDIFVRDRLNGTTERISVDSSGAEGNADSRYPSISADGNCVAFVSAATNFTSGDTNTYWDVFLRDRQQGTTERVNVDSAGTQADRPGSDPCVSADGRYVAFVSEATNLVAGDANGVQDVFVRDRQQATTERVSVGSGGTEGNGESVEPAISADGRFVAFKSYAPNLVTGDTNGYQDVFIRDRQLGTTQLVSVAPGGAQADGSSYTPAISADARFVAFRSGATNLVSVDTNGVDDVFVRDRLIGTTELVSVATGGAQGTAYSSEPSISDDGMFVAYYSPAPNLVAGDTNNLIDVFLRDRSCAGSVYSYCTAKTNSLGCVPSTGSLGVPSQSGPDNFYITASNVLNNKSGMMLWSLASGSNPFFGGTLCVAPTIFRTPAQSSGGNPTGNDCSGTYSYHFTQLYMLQHLLAGNTTVYAQFWSRDPGFPAPYSIGLTNGLSFTICP